MTISFDPSVLISWYQAKANVASGGALGGSTTPAQGAGGTPTNPVPDAPWSAAVKHPAPSALVTAALQGKPFVDEKAAKVDVQNANGDYKKLFAVYTGLQTLQALASAANDPKTPSSQLKSIQSAFQRGMTELQTYLGATKFSEFRLAMGIVSASETTSMAIPAANSITGKITPSDSYETAPVAADSADAAVPAFKGAVVFDVKVKTLTGATTTVHMDLSDMDPAVRSMNSVAAYMNGQFKAAGVGTRVSVDTTTTKAQTVTVGGVTKTITAAQDQYSFDFSGLSSEPITFVPSATQAAVYVSSTAGNPALPSTTSSLTTTSSTSKTTTTDDSHQQLMKLEAGDGSDAARRPGDTNYVSSQIFSEALPAGVSSVGATATGSDGSVYVLANATAGRASEKIWLET
jgi:hypothetical protein